MQPTDSTSPSEDAPAPNPADLIIFLCPNGHKLNGPKGLQGKAGQCPHCGAKFQIPSADDLEEDDADHEDADIGDEFEEEFEVDDEFGDADVEMDLDDDDSTPDVVQLVDDGRRASPIADVELAPSAADAQALSAIIRALQKHSRKDAALEIRLTGGDVLKAVRFSAKLSRGPHGVFGVRGDDGDYTVTSLAWSAIERISVSGLYMLPEDLFD